MPEPGSDALNRALKGRVDLLVSDLAVTEVVSALARRARERSISGEGVRRVQRAIIERLDGGGFQRVEMTRGVHRRAEHLLLSLADAPLRASDALHLALATESRAAAMASFDARLAAAARRVGLATYPT